VSNACKIWIKKGRGEPWQEHDPNGELAALRAKVATLQAENDAMRSTSRGKYAAMNEQLKRENAALREAHDAATTSLCTISQHYREKVEKLERENALLRGTVEALGDANDRLTIEITELRKDRLFK
jgi:hypothetical protein